jgi:hypothetical protein
MVFNDSMFFSLSLLCTKLFFFQTVTPFQIDKAPKTWKQ